MNDTTHQPENVGSRRSEDQLSSSRFDDFFLE